MRKRKTAQILMTMMLSLAMTTNMMQVSATTTGNLITTAQTAMTRTIVAMATVVATEQTPGIANAAIPDHAIIEAITKASNDAKTSTATTNKIAIQVNITMPKNTNSLAATLTQTSLKNLIQAGIASFTIQGAPAMIRFDLMALQEIQSQSKGNVTIRIAPPKELSSGAKGLIDARLALNIAIDYNNNNKLSIVSTLNAGTITIAMPYTPKTTESVGHLFAVAVDAKGNATRIANSAYDTFTQQIMFTTNQFSLYGIGYVEPLMKYSDIATHWAKDSIDYAIGRGLLAGASESTFSPNAAITRGMLVQTLGKLAGIDPKRYTNNQFIDVTKDNPVAPYVAWAVQEGILQGIGAGRFGIDRTIAREEIALILVNFTKVFKIALANHRTVENYTDASTIHNSYIDAVRIMQQSGIMMGKQDNKFSPKANVARYEVAVLLHRLVQLTIDTNTTQGWERNDDGFYLYYKDGLKLTGWQTIDGVRYLWDTNGILQTGWVLDGSDWRYYAGNVMLRGWQEISTVSSTKTYYFTDGGLRISGKWAELEGKWYYFYADGSLAKNTTVLGYRVDENGVRTVRVSGGSTNIAPTPEREFEDRDDEDVFDDTNTEGLFENLNPDNDDEPLPHASSTNYLLYGYNVLKSGYINPDSIDLKFAIFDKTKVIAGEHYEITTPSASDHDYLHSKSVSTLYESLDVSSEAKYKGLFFSGSIAVDYKLTSALSEDKELIKYIQYHQTGNQAYTTHPDELKELLSEYFIADVKKYASGTKETNSNYNPDYILNNYGTHAITQYYLGGRAELNFTFTNRSQASEETVRASVEAAYKGFSGTATDTDNTKSTLVTSASTYRFSSIGGKNITGNNPADIAKKYDTWVTSIEDNPVICGIAEYEKSLYPIWDLIVDKDASANVEAAFVAAAELAGTNLSAFSSIPLYITDIVVYGDKKAEIAKAMIPNDYVRVLLNPGTNNTTLLDANSGAGGQWIFIAYKLSPDKSKAITDIQVVYGDSKNVNAKTGYTKINVDLNEKAGGKFIYLTYKKSTEAERLDSSTKYLKEIRGVYSSTYSLLSSWEWATGKVDLNLGTKKSGSKNIFLTVRKGN